MVPPFEPSGQLPPGVHVATWSVVTQHFGINAHRLRLLAGFLEAAQALHAAGSKWILLNGSFVTSKEFPNDIDACYDDEFLDYDLLELLEPTLLEFANARAAQKACFGCEFSLHKQLQIEPVAPFKISFKKTATTSPKESSNSS